MPPEGSTGRDDPVEMFFPELFEGVDTPLGGPTTSAARRAWPRLGLPALALAALAFTAGVLVNAAGFHLGHRNGPTGVVIGQQLNRPNPPRGPAHQKTPPTTAPAVSLAWRPPQSIDPSGGPQAVSCADSSFCAAVDVHGRALLYEAGGWTAPVDIDGTTPINSVSCPDDRFCMAVDQSGDALTYDGSGWTRPVRVDRTTFDELTSLSCASRQFCGAIDGDGNALLFNGSGWTAPQPVDPQGWNAASRDLASLSCPAPGFCVGTDPENNAFYLVGNSWQEASSIDASTGTPSVKYRNSVACATNTFCVATENLGQVVAYNGTQWSVSVAVDPTDYVASLSCPETTFCAAVDGLLPEGFSAGNGSGAVMFFNGISWSAPADIDGGGILQSISCVSRSFCMAVDLAGHAIVGTS
jgi:hypothetical protein